MRWFWQNGPTASSPSQPPRPTALRDSTTGRQEAEETSSAQDDSLVPTSGAVARSFTNPSTLVATAVLTTAIFALYYVYSTRLRRIPNTSYVPAHYLISRPSRSIFGTVVSVGDPDNFRIYHTPGGRLLGWRWARQIPSSRKELSGQTLHVRIAGIDAPEMAHFGRPAQPYSDDALRWLTETVKGRHVRVYTLRRDQYERVVATAFLRRGLLGTSSRVMMALLPWKNDRTLGPMLSRDIGLEMIRAGWATIYEASFGAEFGAKGMEAVYKEAEKKARAEGRGMWKGQAGVLAHDSIWGTISAWFPWSHRREQQATAMHLESPREYKTRMARLDAEAVARNKSNQHEVLRNR